MGQTCILNVSRFHTRWLILSLQDQRQGVFFKIREKVLRIWEELEVEPEGELELSVAKGDIKTFVLSVDNMKLLEEFHLKVSESCGFIQATPSPTLG